MKSNSHPLSSLYHLNCGSLHPLFPRMQSIVYCLLLETNDGLLLVDTGFGLQDYASPSIMMRGFLRLMGSPRDERETALRQVQSLGYAAEDVRHIVLTHLHLDHAGGLPDFPHAKVHVHRNEYQTMLRPKGLIERGHDRRHWCHKPDWVLYDEVDGEWFGFDSIRVGNDLLPEIFLIPLHGHTRGHCGVAIRTGEGWLFHCGDAASPFHHTVDPHDLPSKLHTLGFIPGWVTRRLIGPHVEKIRQLVRQQRGNVQVISSHDIYHYREHR